jgi:hypothetical protein
MVLLLYGLSCLACSHSAFICNYELYRQLVGLLGRVMSPVARPLPRQRNTNTEESRTHIHASSVIRTHGPRVRSSEDISCLRPSGYCDRCGYWLNDPPPKKKSIALIIFNYFVFNVRSRDNLGGSDGLRTGRPGFDCWQGQEIFSTPQCPDRVWGSPKLLSTGYRDYFPRGKAAGG